METPPNSEALPGKIPGSSPPRFAESSPPTVGATFSAPSTARSRTFPASAPAAAGRYGMAPPIILSVSDTSSQRIVTDDNVDEHALEILPTEAQLQAHIMAYLRDEHDIHFERRLNPSSPKPKYLGTKVALPRGEEAYQYSPRMRRDG